MKRMFFTTKGVRAARELKCGEPVYAVCSKLEISALDAATIGSMYKDVPDALLAKMEKLLVEREKLRHMVATLISRTA